MIVSIKKSKKGSAFKQTMVPSANKCIEIMDKYHMLKNIRAHCFVVARIAYLLATELAHNHIRIDIPLVVSGALLHDIGKTQALNNGGDHVKIGMEICRREGFTELVPLVAEHVRLKGFEPEGNILEKEIVYYSDKRVNHDSIVTLEQRLSYILRRYAYGNPRLRAEILKNFNLCKEVEKKLFRPLPFRAGDISHLAGRKRLPFEIQNGDLDNGC